jgi:hypothetical protein
MGYRMDKNYFKKQTLQEADHNENYWKDKSVEERLSAAWYLICHAYNISYTDPPRMDKNYFKIRKR